MRRILARICHDTSIYRNDTFARVSHPRPPRADDLPGSANLDRHLGPGLRETADLVASADLGAALDGTALENLLQATLGDRQNMKRVAWPEAEPEGERSEREAGRRDDAQTGAGQDAASAEFDGSPAHDPVRLRNERRGRGAFEHQHPDASLSEFAGQQKPHEAGADNRHLAGRHHVSV